ncbi:MAG: RES family NAD+ phosphorylase [Alphaproteobacteria bacterium]
MAPERRAHDDRLLDALGEIEGRAFSGKMWRVVREGRSGLDGSHGAGRWNPADLSVLYGTSEPDGAIAEINYHLTQGQPVFPSRMRHVLHELQVASQNTLVLADMAALVHLGVEQARYKEMLYGRTAKIADAAAFMGFDGVIAPCARWTAQTIVLFLDGFDMSNIEPVSQTPIDWTAWRERNSR